MMNLWLNNIKVSTIGINPTTTIAVLKNTLVTWLDKEGYRNYSFKLIFNNGEELSPIVFTSNNYDAVDFQVQANLLEGSNMYITATKTALVTKPLDPCVGKELNILYSEERRDIVYITTNIEKLLRYWVENIAEDIGDLLETINAKDGVIDYGDADVRDYIYQAIEEGPYIIYMNSIDS
jgi:hypothetical protein